ncbi:hypothetical protein V7139_16395 [Neobacillus drentensis]|uniref:hypothetical protein n=1 Tax=Neobacillus drentensis TaxID=220684 RepID=UPI0030032D3A
MKKFRKLFTAFIYTTVLQEAKDASIPVILTDRNVDAHPSLYKTMIGGARQFSIQFLNSIWSL